ncbi:MAG: hypothetical protein CL816_02555 [Coxiellaceae bacterium]|nr:hypothetical protein [Coxiellaceae bacterium]|tara:strand:+ start:7864 stop:8619 length:756 start_codon:yes stop_codon:yes gene_type:complete
MTITYITTHNTQLINQAKNLAQELNLLYNPNPEGANVFTLNLTHAGLELTSLDHPKQKPLRIDFLSGSNYHRYRFGGGKRQLIGRAIGLKSGYKPSILDLTAGLGRDGFVLASLGCSVTLLERSPVLYALLRDGLQRAHSATWFQTLSLTLHHQEAHKYLASLPAEQYPEVIYCDPMFPESKQTALVKKDMRLLRDLIGDDLDADLLLPKSLKVATKRVVVKRHLHAPFINQSTPSIQFKGKSSRYDVYLC